MVGVLAGAGLAGPVTELPNGGVEVKTVGATGIEGVAGRDGVAGMEGFGATMADGGGVEGLGGKTGVAPEF